MIASEIVRHVMAVPPGPKPGASSAQPTGVSAGFGGRLLVVEDDYLVGMSLETTLLEAGYEVLDLIATGEEAVRKGAELRPDLVLMYIRLGGQMTGVEAAIELRALGIPCLFASAHSDPGTRASGEEARPVGWLSKPFSQAEALSAVAAALARLRRH